MSERRERARALEVARAEATEAVEAWVNAPLAWRAARQSDARRALAKVAEAERHLADFAAWDMTTDEPSVLRSPQNR